MTHPASGSAGRSFLSKTGSTGLQVFEFKRQEQDDEVKGKGNSIDYKYRVNDPRIGRFFSVDPLAQKYAYNSPYAFSENRVIDAVELDGLESAALYLPDNLTTEQVNDVFMGYDQQTEIVIVIASDIAEMGGGAAMVYLGGGATHLAGMGYISIAGGTTKLYFHLTGQDEKADNIPTSVTSGFLNKINLTLDNDNKISDAIISVGNVLEDKVGSILNVQDLPYGELAEIIARPDEIYDYKDTIVNSTKYVSEKIALGKKNDLEF